MIVHDVDHLHLIAGLILHRQLSLQIRLAGKLKSGSQGICCNRRVIFRRPHEDKNSTTAENFLIPKCYKFIEKVMTAFIDPMGHKSTKVSTPYILPSTHPVVINP